MLISLIREGLHCVKSVQIRIYFWSVSSCIRTEYRKIRTKNNIVFGQFSRKAFLKRIKHKSQAYLLIQIKVFRTLFVSSGNFSTTRDQMFLEKRSAEDKVLCLILVLQKGYLSLAKNSISNSWGECKTMIQIFNNKWVQYETKTWLCM